MQDPRSHTCCFSGYRPEKMPFRTYDPDAVQALEAALDRAVEYAVSQGYHTFLSGMAAGFDIWAAEAVIRARAHHDIRLLCAVPHDHQSDRFAPSWKKRYNVCLVNSDAVRVFASNYFSGCFSVRNRFMVDSSSLLICYFDGQAGGTAQTVHYAQSSGLHIINLSQKRTLLPDRSVSPVQISRRFVNSFRTFPFSAPPAIAFLLQNVYT